MNTFLSTDTVIEVAYLIATALFILSLKWLSSPTTARRGVFAGEAGMVLAIAGTLLHHGIVDYKWIAIALVLGTVIGVLLLGVISNMLTMLGVENYIQGVVKGCIIIGAVLIQRGRRQA